MEQFDELELTQKIYQLLVIEEIYLQHGLTVGEFAKKLGVQARIVTQILDNLYGHSFKELTNMYRIEYAKERIEEGFLDSYTLEALGQEAGFSSRTTFFNVFKKEIGICPSEYWKKYLAQAA
ncbi:AraC family transcriptional regulator [Algoriphagus sp.]|uniref:helix-turn-helix domain-containing protein n=1 Tax=Algoriphagus sp. TaxID=1872435 RepID=UPI002724F01E|nr:helix-turn-helix domain-containing protein [Algoriphagus sp.]MDO8966195.1 helix-turn-helix domain-containing protein [Algoriphagus sp.]